MIAFNARGVYAIVDSEIHRDYGLERLLRDIVTTSTIAVIQLRLKKYSLPQKISLITVAHELKQMRPFSLIVNDDSDLLSDSHGCAHMIDGLHLGQKDLAPFSLARAQYPHHIMGLSTHALEQARTAQRQNADYIGCGAVFPTTSKINTESLSLNVLRKIVSEVKIPKVAIGGICLDNITTIAATSCEMAAVMSGLIAGGRFVGNHLQERFCAEQKKENSHSVRP